MQSESYEKIPSETLIDQTKCAGIVFAETSVLSGESTKLEGARRYVAGVAYARNGGGVARPVIPTAEELRNPITARIWNLCLQAARDAANDDLGNCKHFVIWYSDDQGRTPSKVPREMEASWPYREIDKIRESWGPFSTNVDPLFIPIDHVVVNEDEDILLSADNIYVIKYCGVR